MLDSASTIAYHRRSSGVWIGGDETRILLSTALSVALLWPSGASKVNAAGCDPHASDVIGSKFAYALQSNFPLIDGVRASVLEYRPFVPFELFKTRATSAWVMLSQIGYPRWAQIGWQEYALNYRKVFVQYWNGSGYPVTEWNPNPDWTYGEYKVVYTGTQFLFYNRGTLVKTVSAAFNPDEGQIASEIANELNQMPGDYGALSFMAFNNMNKSVAGHWGQYLPTSVSTSNNAKWYASNTRGGMNSATQLVTADKRGDCA
jgi:hypothetical protein